MTSAPDLHAVDLADIPLDPPIADCRTLMRERHGAEPVDRRFTRDVFARQQYVLNLIADGDTVLDVGVGQGIFANAAANSGRHPRVEGVDIRYYDHFIGAAGWTQHTCDVTALDSIYQPREFDTATAMEIIEHLPDDKLAAAVDQIRRVARRVIVTVPYRERKLPSYHLQRFDETRLLGLFPNGKLTLLNKQRRGRTPWLLVDETPAVTPA